MILDEHDVADRKRRVEAARGIGDDQRVDVEALHDSHGQRHLLHGIAFVVVEAALHRAHDCAGKFADHEPPGMTGDSADRKEGNLIVGDDGCLFDLGRQVAQAAAQDQAGGWPVMRARA